MDIDYSRSASLRRGFISLVLVVLIGVPLGFALWSWAAITFVYSHGERAGYVQKISKRGWVFKTWEGELAMANLPGSMPQIFSFTVRNDDTAQQIVNIIGQRASISYEEHRGLPGTFLGETPYFVTKVTPVADPYQLQPKAAVPPVTP